MVRISIVGGSGYNGGELLRILANHSKVEITYVTSKEYIGKPIAYVHPNLRGFYSLKFSEYNLDKITKLSDVVFLSVPHGVSMKLVPNLLDVGLRVVDLSADYRLKDPNLYKIWYGYEHPQPDLLRKAVYGLPELHADELYNATLIASPGCNATASILALAPLIANNLIDERIIIDIKAGSSESGSKPTETTHHPEREHTIRPYEAEGHRHVAEVEQELTKLSKKSLKISLVPHAVSSVRGVLASAHGWIKETITQIDLWRIIAEFYRGKSFIRIVKGVPPYPDPKYVIGSNFADVGFALEERIGRVTMFTAIDNLIKGGAGQAVQAFNISMGFDEKEGLMLPPLRPV